MSKLINVFLHVSCDLCNSQKNGSRCGLVFSGCKELQLAVLPGLVAGFGERIMKVENISK